MEAWQERALPANFDKALSLYKAWLLAKAGSSSTALVPILGSRTREQLDATLGAVKLALTAAQLAQLDAASAFELGTPHDAIVRSVAGITGGQAAQLRAPFVPAA